MLLSQLVDEPIEMFKMLIKSNFMHHFVLTNKLLDLENPGENCRPSFNKTGRAFQRHKAILQLFLRYCIFT